MSESKVPWRPKALSDIQIGMLLAWKQEKISTDEIARRLKVSDRTVRNYLKKYRNQLDEGGVSGAG